MEPPSLAIVHRGAVDGVPLLWIDRPGPVVLEIVLRVGAHDETLPTHGTTHLLEHLALEAVELPDPRVNAWTSPLFTGLAFTGPAREVAELVRRVVAGLHDPPAAPLERERRVLEAEEAHRGGWPGHRALGLRYGPRGPGLPVFREYGLRTADLPRLRAWAARTCTAGNAMVWCLGPPPPGLRVELPPGERRPPAPAPPPAPVTLPGEAEHGEDEVVLSLVGPGSLALRVGIAAVREHAFARLRTELGLVYDVSSEADDVDGELAHGVIAAGNASVDATRVREELIAATRAVADGTAPGAVRAAVGFLQHLLADPDAHAGILGGTARRELLGAAAPSPQELAERLAALDAGEVAAAVAAALPSALVLVPEGTPPGPWPSCERATPTPAQGREHRARLVPRSASLSEHRAVLGDDRLSVHDGEQTTTVRFADVVALVRLPGGAFDLIAADGSVAELRPRDLRDGDALTRAVDDAVPADRVVPLDERDARLAAAVAAAGINEWTVGDAPDVLGALLAPDEPVAAIAEASRGVRAGVLVLTDRRLLLNGKLLADRLESWPLDGLERLAVRAGRGGGRLEFVAGGERVRIGLVWPKQARAFAEALRRRRADAAPRRS